MKIISVVGDMLWASGSKYVAPEESDPDFTPNQALMDDFNNLLSENTETADVDENDQVGSNDETGPNDTEEGTEETAETEVDSNLQCESPNAKSIDEIRKEQDDLLNIAFKAAIKRKIQPEKVRPVRFWYIFDHDSLGEDLTNTMFHFLLAALAQLHSNRRKVTYKENFIQKAFRLPSPARRRRCIKA